MRPVKVAMVYNQGVKEAINLKNTDFYRNYLITFIKALIEVSCSTNNNHYQLSSINIE